jgi:hypothetical protein
MDQQLHNNQKLTIEELRSCPGCECLTDEEALQIIETAYQLSLLIYKITAQQDEFIFDLQPVVYLKNEQENNNPENLDRAA